jgi:hypothetical protein
MTQADHPGGKLELWEERLKLRPVKGEEGKENTEKAGRTPTLGSCYVGGHRKA